MWRRPALSVTIARLHAKRGEIARRKFAPVRVDERQRSTGFVRTQEKQAVA
jgi:hypothetical protein